MTSDISSEELSEEDEEEEEEEEEGSEDGYDVFGESSNEENEVDLLQKIFGESEDDEEEEGAESEMRLQKDRPVTPTKTRAPGKRRREEMSLQNITTTTAPPSPPPPTDDVLHPLTPPPEPLAPPTQTPPKEEPKRPKFKPRGEREDERSVREARVEPLDKEDIAMLRLALGRLREEGAGLVGGVNWAYHPNVSTGAPPPKRRRQGSQDLLVHATGCARSEGYYKIDARDKVKYLPHHRRKLRLNEKLEKKASSGRINRAKLRRLASVFSTSDVSSDLAKYNQLKARKKLLKFSKSTIHNWGLFAIEAIAADEMVIEYVGEVVRQAVADERERRYEAAGIGSSYLFRVDHDYIIDATRNGNMARFINHCCDVSLEKRGGVDGKVCV
jgi:histone-lysine N-methyltransferase SETD1